MNTFKHTKNTKIKTYTFLKQLWENQKENHNYPAIRDYENLNIFYKAYSEIEIPVNVIVDFRNYLLSDVNWNSKKLMTYNKTWKLFNEDKNIDLKNCNNLQNYENNRNIQG